jgi:hypothetical protein
VPANSWPLPGLGVCSHVQDLWLSISQHEPDTEALWPDVLTIDNPWETRRTSQSRRKCVFGEYGKTLCLGEPDRPPPRPMMVDSWRVEKRDPIQALKPDHARNIPSAHAPAVWYRMACEAKARHQLETTPLVLSDHSMLAPSTAKQIC